MVSVSRRCLWLALVPLALGACGNDSSSGTSASSHVPIALSDAGCNPAQATAEAGKIAFDVTNQGSSKVTEFYVKQNSKTLGEVENVVQGTPKTLTLTLKPGTYDMQCPNGTTTERGTLTVTAAGSGSHTSTSCTGPGEGGYGKGSGNLGGSGTNDASGDEQSGGSVDGTSSGCGDTGANQPNGTTPPSAGGNGGGGQPGGNVTPNVTTNP